MVQRRLGVPVTIAVSFMNLFRATILFFRRSTAGAINAIAGGGSFVSFPTLLFVGIPPVNATPQIRLPYGPDTWRASAGIAGSSISCREKP
jgi:hypothetical protein